MDEMQIGSGAIASGLFWLTIGLAVLALSLAASLAIVAYVWKGANPAASVIDAIKGVFRSWFGK